MEGEGCDGPLLADAGAIVVHHVSPSRDPRLFLPPGLVSQRSSALVSKEHFLKTTLPRNANFNSRDVFAKFNRRIISHIG